MVCVGEYMNIALPPLSSLLHHCLFLIQRLCIAGRTRPDFSRPILIGLHVDVISKQFDID